MVFCETWYIWRKVMPTLAEAGQLVLAPDMRGYATADKPESGYGGRTLAEDSGSSLFNWRLGRVFAAPQVSHVNFDAGQSLG